jgi:hypothetical protein
MKIILIVVFFLALSVCPSVQVRHRTIPYVNSCPNLSFQPITVGIYTLRRNATLTSYDLLNVIGNGLLPRFLEVPGFQSVYFSYVNDTSFVAIGSFVNVPYNFILSWYSTNGILAQTSRIDISGQYQFFQSNCVTRGLQGRAVRVILDKLLPNATQTAPQLLQLAQTALFSFYQNQVGFRIFAGFQTTAGSPYDLGFIYVFDTTDQLNLAIAGALSILTPLGFFNQVARYPFNGQVTAEQTARFRRGFVQVPYTGS